MLYALDVGYETDPQAAVDQYRGLFDLELDEEGRAFAAKLVSGTRAHLPEIDDAIQSASRNWRLDRMSRVDRNILRMGCFELRQVGEVPVSVILNEAIELAKRFGAEESASFVNGILDRIARVKPNSDGSDGEGEAT